MLTTTTQIRIDGRASEHGAWLTLGYPQANGDGRLRFGFEAEIAIDTDVYHFDEYRGPEVKVSQSAIQACVPAEARLRAAICMLAVEIGERLLDLLDQGSTPGEAVQFLMWAKDSWSNVEWNVSH